MIIQGVAEIGGGDAMIGGGGTVSLSGGGAVVGVPVALVGAGVAVHGTIAGSIATANLIKMSMENTDNSGPKEPYSRRKHYGNTPTKKDREALGATDEEVVDHKRSLVEHYYEGDGNDGIPGHEMTKEERVKFGKDRDNMQNQKRTDSNAQGGEKSSYSKGMKKKFFNDQRPKNE